MGRIEVMINGEVHYMMDQDAERQFATEYKKYLEYKKYNADKLEKERVENEKMEKIKAMKNKLEIEGNAVVLNKIKEDKIKYEKLIKKYEQKQQDCRDKIADLKQLKYEYGCYIEELLNLIDQDEKRVNLIWEILGIDTKNIDQ